MNAKYSNFIRWSQKYGIIWKAWLSDLGAEINDVLNGNGHVLVGNLPPHFH